MHTITQRRLTALELGQLQSRQLPFHTQVWHQVLGVLIWALPFVALVYFIARRSDAASPVEIGGGGHWNVFAPFETAGYGVIATWAVFVLIRSLRRRWHKAAPLRADIVAAQGEVNRFQAQQAIRIAEGEEGDAEPTFLIWLKDGRTLLVQGRAFAEAAAQQRFPCSEFLVTRSPKARQFIALECLGSPLPPVQSQAQLPEQVRRDGDWRGQFELAKLDFAALLQHPTRTEVVPLIEPLPAAAHRVSAWLSPEWALALVGSLIHIGFAYHGWQLNEAATVTLNEQTKLGGPCDAQRTLQSQFIGDCEQIAYSVIGTTAASLLASIEANTLAKMPDAASGRVAIYHSFTNYRMFWDWDTRPEGEGQCKLKRLRVAVHVQYLMPNWLDRSKASAALQKRYAEWEDANWELLRRMVQVEVDSADDILKTLMALPAESCEAFEQRANATASERTARGQPLRDRWFVEPQQDFVKLASRDWMKQWQDEVPAAP